MHAYAYVFEFHCDVNEKIHTHTYFKHSQYVQMIYVCGMFVIRTWNCSWLGIYFHCFAVLFECICGYVCVCAYERTFYGVCACLWRKSNEQLKNIKKTATTSTASAVPNGKRRIRIVVGFFFASVLWSSWFIYTYGTAVLTPFVARQLTELTYTLIQSDRQI